MDPSWPEAKFGDEKDVTLKVWAPDAAVDLTKKQVAAFKEHYSDSGVNFNIEVVPQGENEAATQIVTDKEAAADVFGFPSDQMTNLMSSQVLTKVNPKFAYSIKKYCAENPVNAATKTVDGEENLYAFPETNDNGYYLVYDKSIVKDPTKLESILADCRAAGRTFVMDSGNGFYSCVFMFTGGAIIDGLDNGTQKFKDYKEEDVVKTLMAFAKLMKTYKGTFASPTRRLAQASTALGTPLLTRRLSATTSALLSSPPLRLATKTSRWLVCSVTSTSVSTPLQSILVPLQSLLTISQVRNASSRELRTSVGAPLTQRQWTKLLTIPYSQL